MQRSMTQLLSICRRMVWTLTRRCCAILSSPDDRTAWRVMGSLEQEVNGSRDSSRPRSLRQCRRHHVRTSKAVAGGCSSRQRRGVRIETLGSEREEAGTRSWGGMRCLSRCRSVSSTTLCFSQSTKLRRRNPHQRCKESCRSWQSKGEPSSARSGDRGAWTMWRGCR